jgi:dCTP deaminase
MNPGKDQTLSLFPELEQDLAAFRTTGILPAQKIQQLIDVGSITSEANVDDEQIQPASLDLRLGAVAYEITASFLPRATSTVLQRVSELVRETIDLTVPTVLAAGRVYIVPLMERLSLPAQVGGRGNPKSTMGRLDVFTRLLTDYGEEFDRIAPGYRGGLYIEIAPQSFSVIVSRGLRMYQARFVKGRPRPSDNTLRELNDEGTLVFDEDQARDAVIQNGLRISVDLIGDGSTDPIGYVSRKDAPPIDLQLFNHYDPAAYWKPITPVGGRIALSPTEFYLLVSKERICVKPEFAAELVPFDPSMGEFRVHYAGFFDPGFGYAANQIGGARAVLEVRVYGLPFLLEDGQIIGRLVFERLQAIPTKVYGLQIGSSYQNQGLALSKQFKRPSWAPASRL